ncbi:MAG: bifunctional folylpolyglutamate synthase/dihydrofolate synthase [Ruminococcus sp.]|nr:bifunctional folylpolyglutamate synthase/dihydrofolate synthase [Ruminococcus sp.]
MADYSEILDYLRTASLRGSHLGLERITELCRRLGDPQNKVKIIHISGTNGKGSFLAMLSAVLTAAGYKTGSFSSPGLTGVTDSFRIDGKELSEADFSAVMSEIIPVCEAVGESGNGRLTEFEILTGAAFRLFDREKCDIALVECGMGGSTDSTNTIEAPLLSVITNVSIDHTAFLGNTAEEIASCKAGIIKPGRPVLFGGNDKTALEIIKNRAESCGSRLIVTDDRRITVTEESIRGMTLADAAFGELKLRLAGTYQRYNCANVLTAIEILREEGLEIPEAAVKSGLLSAVWHGRFEVMCEKPLVIYDGAHNPDGIRQAAATLDKYIDGEIALLIGVMADKEYELYPEMLGKFIDTAFTVAPANPRSLDSRALAEVFRSRGITAIPYDSMKSAVKSAAEYAEKHKLPLIALGSLYMYREFSEALINLYPRSPRG